MAPILLVRGLGIRLFDTDEEATLKIEQSVQIEEYVVYAVACHNSLLFNESFERLQQFKMLNVCAFRFHQFINNMLPLSPLDSGCYGSVVRGLNFGGDYAHLY